MHVLTVFLLSVVLDSGAGGGVSLVAVSALSRWGGGVFLNK